MSFINFLGIIMNTKFVATTLILASGLIAGTSFAQVTDRSDATSMRLEASANMNTSTSALTREQVVASVLQARADGSLARAQLNEGERSKRTVQPAPSTVSVEQVRAEAVVAAHTRAQEFGG
jgi:hypothetical protein